MYLPGGSFLGMSRGQRLVGRGFRQPFGIELAHIRRARLLPAGGIRRQHGHGHVGRGLRVIGNEPARVEDSIHQFRGCHDARRVQLAAISHGNHFADGGSAFTGTDAGGFEKSAANRRTIPEDLWPRHWQQLGIRLLHLGQGFGSLHRAAQRGIVKTIGRSACRTAIEDGADGDLVVLLGHVLRDRVVGKARERTLPATNQQFDFIGGGERANAGEQVGGFVGCQHECKTYPASTFSRIVIPSEARNRYGR